MSIYRGIFVSIDCHQKAKVIASLEGQSIKEWVEWVVEHAYEAALHNRSRKGLSVLKKENEKGRKKESIAKIKA